jgi:hypothetical protein
VRVQKLAITPSLADIDESERSASQHQNALVERLRQSKYFMVDDKKQTGSLPP